MGVLTKISGAIALAYAIAFAFTIASTPKQDYPPVNQKDCLRDSGTIVYSRDIYPVAIACKK